MATINHLQGYAFAKKKGDTIHVFEGPHTLADFMPVIAEGSDIPRMLKDRFADVVNVRDYGAVGDGISDDTGAIQAAFDYAVSKPECTVVFPAGTYACDKGISVQGTGELTILAESAEIYSRKTSVTPDEHGIDSALSFKGVPLNESAAKVYEAEIAQDAMVVDNIWGDLSIQEGDLIRFTSSQVSDTEYRAGSWTQSFLAKVSYIDEDNKIHLADPVPMCLYQRFFKTVRVTEVKSETQAVLDVSGIDDTSRDFMRMQAIINGKTHWIVQWDEGTSTATFGDAPENLQVGTEVVLSHWTGTYVYRPIQLHIRGLKVKRDLVTDAEPGSESFTGVRCVYGDNCDINDVTVENFPNIGIHMYLCYKSLVHGGKYLNANRIYNVNDGIGNGISLFGCSYCVIDGNLLKGNRAGCTTGGQICRTVGCVFSNNTVYGTDKPSYTGEELAPTGNIDDLSVGRCYGLGGHGDALRCSYIGNTIYDVPMGFKLRGEDTIVQGNSFFGNIATGVAIYSVKGGIIKDNMYYPTLVGKTRGEFASISAPRDGAGYNPRKRLVFDGNVGINVHGPFIKANTLDWPNPIYENIVFKNNYVRFAKEGTWPKSGFAYGSDSNMLITLKNCTFENNTIEYEDGIELSSMYGFASPYYLWDIPTNNYVKVDRDMYYLHIAAGGSLTITVGGGRLSPICLDFTGLNRREHSLGGIILSMGNNVNPATENLTDPSTMLSSYVVLLESDAEKIYSDYSEYKRMFIYNSDNRQLTIVNRTDHDSKLFMRAGKAN